MNNWERIKFSGSDHYKSGDVQPIDIFRSGDILLEWVIGEIIQHAFRNRYQATGEKGINSKDFIKIKHYCDIILADYLDKHFLKKEQGEANKGVDEW